MRRIVIDFLWISVVIALILGVISYFYPNLGSSSGAVTTTVAAMTAGQMYGQRTGTEVSKGFAWKAAAWMTVASLALAAVVLGALKAADIPLLPDGSVELSLGTWALITMFISILVLLVTRFTFRWGVKTGVKAAALRRERAK